MNALIHWFLTSTGKGAEWLFVWSWQASVLLVLVWLGLKLFRAKSPAIRHQVWLLALVVVVALPICAWLVERLPLSQPEPRPAARILSYAVEIPKIIITPSPEAVAQTSPVATQVRASAKLRFLSLLFVAWLIGAAVVLLRIVKQYVRLRTVRMNARPVTFGDLDCGDFKIGRTSISLSPDIESPLTFSIFHPMILIPADIAGWTEVEERRAIIRHELAHVERRDTLVNLFLNALSVLFFFHPMVRYTCRQLRLEREMACDDRVISSGSDAVTYAEGLLKVAEHSISSSWSPSSVHGLALISAKHILERRIEMILNKDRARVIALRWKYLILPVTLIALVAWLLLPSRLTKARACATGR